MIYMANVTTCTQLICSEQLGEVSFVKKSHTLLILQLLLRLPIIPIFQLAVKSVCESLEIVIMTLYNSRISEPIVKVILQRPPPKRHTNVFKGVAAALFALAIIVAVVRITLRQRSPNCQRVPIDDVFLCLACIFLCVGTSLFYALMPCLYAVESGVNGFSLTSSSPDAEHRLLWLQNMVLAYQVMTWSAIFCVKASFLCFFRRLVDRLRPMLILWRTVAGLTTFSYIVIFCDLFVGCPDFNIKACEFSSQFQWKVRSVDMHISSSMPERSGRYARLGYRYTDCVYGCNFGPHELSGPFCFANSLILTLPVISIPVYLLWKVKIKLRQKLWMGTFLCLSAFMIVIAIVRLSGLRTQGTTLDLVWKRFWQQVEACVAVLMVSLTACYAFFMADSSSSGDAEVRLWQYPQRSVWNQVRRVRDNDGRLPTIPSATLTGMRTMIRGEQRFSIPRPEIDRTSSDTQPLRVKSQGIKVISDIEIHSERVRFYSLMLYAGL